MEERKARYRAAAEREKNCRERIEAIETCLDSSNIEEYVKACNDFISRCYVDDDDIEHFFCKMEKAVGKDDAKPYEVAIFKKAGYDMMEMMWTKATAIVPYDIFIDIVEERFGDLNLVERFTLTKYHNNLEDGFFSSESVEKIADGVRKRLFCKERGRSG